MSSPTEALRAMWPALAFLLAAVPMAAMLDDLGFFDAAAAVVAARTTSVLGLWLLAAATTVVLNLDTTVVLLTPLYLRLARRVGVDPLPLAAIPLLLAGLASSVLPVSNLTTLIATEALGLSVLDVVAHLALPSAAAVVVGWLAYRRRGPVRLPPTSERPVAVPPSASSGRPAVTDLDPTADRRRALVTGGSVVAAVLVGFTLGPSVGVPAWVVAVLADAVLVALTRKVPWRRVPLLTAAGIAALGAVVAVVVPEGRLDGLLGHEAPLALMGITGLAAGAANLVNNLPALLVSLGSTTSGSAASSTSGATWGQWAWLLGVNVGAVLLPLGAIANLLWWRILRAEGVTVGLRRYVSITVPVAGPALVAAAATLALERLVTLHL